MRICLLLIPLLGLSACAPSLQQRDMDSEIANEVASTRAIDTHAHPVAVVSEGQKDSEFDALPVEMMEPYDTPPLRVRADNPEFEGASRALFGKPEEKRNAMRAKGDSYPDWVLDKLGIEIMFANRVAMGRGLDPARFKWVPFADALMYPLNNESLGRHDPDRKAFFGAEQKLLVRYLGGQAMPATLDGYIEFVSSTLDGWKKQGAVAAKFEMSYLRSFDIGNPDKTDAERVYAKYVKSGVPADAEYKTLQDYIFRQMALECGRIVMPVHLHSSAGAGRYFDVPGGNPMLLVPVMLDPAMRKTNFVLVHGGWPYTREVTALLDKPNIYVDYSMQTMLLNRRDVAETLRRWLEYAPEKVMFATDASPFGGGISWEETGYVSAMTAREALGLALTGMLRDKDISKDRAVQLAHMVLHDNAKKLYGL